MITKQKTFWFAVGGLLLVAIALRIALSYWLYPPVVQPVTPGSHPNELGSAVIIYTDAGFNPKTINVDAPTIVTFKNESSKPFQPISNHGLYPEGPCIDNTEYGSCKSIPSGNSWAGRFENDGAWGYHDQLNASATATIIVSNAYIGRPADNGPVPVGGPTN